MSVPVIEIWLLILLHSLYISDIIYCESISNYKFQILFYGNFFLNANHKLYRHKLKKVLNHCLKTKKDKTV